MLARTFWYIMMFLFCIFHGCWKLVIDRNLDHSSKIKYLTACNFKSSSHVGKLWHWKHFHFFYSFPKSGVLCLSQVSCNSQSTSLVVHLPINSSSSMLVLWSTHWHLIWTADGNHFNVDDLRRLKPWPVWCRCSALPVRVWVLFRPIFCYGLNSVPKDQ